MNINDIIYDCLGHLKKELYQFGFDMELKATIELGNYIDSEMDESVSVINNILYPYMKCFNKNTQNRLLSNKVDIVKDTDTHTVSYYLFDSITEDDLDYDYINNKLDLMTKDRLQSDFINLIKDNGFAEFKFKVAIKIIVMH